MEETNYWSNLPLEVIEHILQFTPRSIFTLMCCNRAMHGSLSKCHEIWRHFCDECDALDLKKSNFLMSWRETYQLYRKMVRKIELNSSFNSNRYFYEHPLQQPEGIHYRANNNKRPRMERKLRQQPEINMKYQSFVYAYSDVYFVLLHMGLKSPFQCVTVWKCENDQWITIVTSKLDLPDFRLPYQHGQVWRHYFFCIPFEASEKYQGQETVDCLLMCFDLEKDFKLVHCVRENPGILIQRSSPIVGKEEGSRRLYTYNDKLVMVDAIPEWNIWVYDIIVSDQGLNLVKVFSTQLSYGLTNAVNPFFSADQKGGFLAFAFLSKTRDSTTTRSALASSKIEILDLDRGTLCTVTPSELSVSFNNTFRHRAPTPKVKLYLLALGCETGKAETFLDTSTPFPCSKVMDTNLTTTRRPVIVTLSADGTVHKFGRLQTLRRACPLLHEYQYCTEDWVMNEMVVYGQFIFILQYFLDDRIVYALDLTTLDLKWNVQLSPLGNSLDRFYLSSFLNMVVLADCESISFRNVDTGQTIGQIQMRPSNRISESQTYSHPDTNPYAQSGSCIWELERKGSKIMVVHDIERSYPLAFEIISLV